MIIPTNELNLFCSLNIEKYNSQSLDIAYSFVKNIAKGHYENFPVGSIFVPKRLRKYIYSIYTFARIADDIADEISKENPSEALILLDKYKDCLTNCLSKKETNNPIFLSLEDTITENKLPIELFERLLIAFKRDIYFTQPDSFDALFDYCNYSANPVGELILRLFNENNDKTIFYSNKICSALQLINFMQDLSLDINRNRNYFPKSLLLNHSTINKDILDEYISVTQNLLNSGATIIKLISNFRLRTEIRLILFGGKIMLWKIKRYSTKLLRKRPKI